MLATQSLIHITAECK